MQAAGQRVERHRLAESSKFSSGDVSTLSYLIESESLLALISILKVHAYQSVEPLVSRSPDLKFLDPAKWGAPQRMGSNMSGYSVALA